MDRCVKCKAPVSRHKVKSERGIRFKYGYCANGHVQTCERLDKGAPWASWPVIGC